MKAKILRELKVHLMQTHSPATAKKYFSAVNQLFEGWEFLQITELKPVELEQRLKGLRSRKDISAAKRGLLALQQIYPDLRLPPTTYFEQLSASANRPPKKTFQAVKLETIQRRINGMKEVGPKTAFRLMLVSGLRVSELAALRKEDISVGESGGIRIHVEHGKGGKSRDVQCLEDSYTAERLRVILSEAEEEPVFPSAQSLQQTAAKRNFECHDLRRAFAKTYNQQLQKAKLPTQERKAKLMQAMGHNDWETTQSYLSRRIEV